MTIHSHIKCLYYKIYLAPEKKKNRLNFMLTFTKSSLYNQLMKKQPPTPLTDDLFALSIKTLPYIMLLFVELL